MDADKLKKKNFTLRLMIIGFFVFILSVLFFGGWYTMTFKPKSYTTIIKTNEKIVGLHVGNQGNTYSIYYRIPSDSPSGIEATEEFFQIDTNLDNNFKEDLESPFFSCDNRVNRKLLYIVLDISGSVVNGIGQDYFNQVISKIRTILSSEILKPGDQIRIRFMGTNNEMVENLDFTGPQFNYDLSKNSVQRKNIINLLGYSDKPLTKCQDNANIVSLRDLSEKLRFEYDKRKQNPDQESNISNLLENISSEVSIEKDRFKSVSYIIFTDGDSTDGYAGCDSNPAEECGKNIKELNMKNESLNKVYLIWVKDKNKQEIFRRLFNNITVNFQ